MKYNYKKGNVAEAERLYFLARKKIIKNYLSPQIFRLNAPPRKRCAISMRWTEETSESLGSI